MPEMPEKNAEPSAQPSTSSPSKTSSVLSVVQTLVQATQTRWIQFRPTALQGLQVLTRTLQQWSTQLETQEKIAQERGESTAQPIDWTPLKRVAATFWSKTQPLWQRILEVLRPRLPDSFQPLSDRSLSGILAGTLLLVLWFFSLIPSGQATPKPIDRPLQPSASSRSISARKDPTVPQPIREIPTRRTAPPQDYDLSYDSVPVAIPDRLTTAKPTAVPKTAVSATPASSAAVPRSAPLKSSESVSASAPERLSLSPDAQKRAKLRQDLDVIAGSLMENAIVGIRPQFANHSLTITLSDRWYSSTESTQDKLANSLLVIAQGKSFNQLQLEAADGTILARSPVVGEGMVILQRAL